MKACIDASLPELQARMPWALDDPQTIDDKIELLRGMRSKFDGDTDYTMGVFTPDGSRQLGGTGLHPRIEPGAFEIGYFVRSDSAGQGLAKEVTGVLVDVGLRHCGASRIEINVEPDNERSLAIPRSLGFLEEGLLRGRCHWPDRPARDVVVFSMFPDTWDPDRTAGYKAFDALGRAIHVPH